MPFTLYEPPKPNSKLSKLKYLHGRLTTALWTFFSFGSFWLEHASSMFWLLLIKMATTVGVDLICKKIKSKGKVWPYLAIEAFSMTNKVTFMEICVSRQWRHFYLINFLPLTFIFLLYSFFIIKLKAIEWAAMKD